MLSANVEQRVNIKFLTKLGKSATDTYNLLTEVYGDQCLFRTQVFEWFKKFKEGREYVGDDPKSGRPSTAKTQENVEKVARIASPYQAKEEGSNGTITWHDVHQR